MKANELRIGNYVEVDGVICKVTEVRENGVRLDYFCESTLIKRNSFVDYERVKLITLTEEWLLRFGAIEEIKGIFVIDRFKLIWKNEYNYWYIIDRYNDCYYSKVEFVHEWQNIYFALNGIEL